MSLQGHVPVTQNMHTGVHQIYGSSLTGSHRVSFGPDPSHPTSPGPHPGVGEHQAGSKPADCWGQQNHSLKQKVLRGGRTSWGLSKCPQHPAQAATHPTAQGIPVCPWQEQAPSSLPGLPSSAPLSKALLGATCPSHTALKSQQEHKTSLPRLPLSVKEPKITPLLKTCAPRDLTSPDETMMVKTRTAEQCFYLFCAVCPMRNCGEAIKNQGKPCRTHEEIPWFSLMQDVLCGSQTISPKSYRSSSISGVGAKAGRE